MGDAARTGMTFHPERDRLMAEAHARPSTPLDAPITAIRIASLSGEGGVADREHLASLCRSSLLPVPGADAKWWAVDAGVWSLRWERHTEFSSWTIFMRSGSGGPPTAWLAALPGEVLVATQADIRTAASETDAPASGSSMIGARVLDGAASVFTDFKPDDRGTTRMLVLLRSADRALVGRLVQMLLEIETYRLMALLAFPLAGRAGAAVARFEAEAGALAAKLAEDAGVDADRKLLQRIVALSGEAEALNTQTSYRFRAAAAYYGIVGDRIATLREERIPGMQTIGEFMDRRLAPAMRTCDAVAEREASVIDRIARAGEMLRTRIEIEAEATNAALLASMDRRSAVQLRLQRTVEGLSVAAIAYYAISLLAYPVKAVEKQWAGFDAVLAIGLLTPVVVVLVWLAIRRLRRHGDTD
ncbi:MAG: DUF3422 family protein [Sphingomonadaceae bacterium]